MTNENVLEDVLTSVEKFTKKPENFLTVQAQVASRFQNNTKRLYDLTKNETKRENDALPELVVNGFDTEQIWQQLELQNEAELTHFLTGVAKALAGNKTLTLPVSVTQKEDSPQNTEDSTKNDEEIEEEEEKPQDAEFSDSDDEMDLDMDISGKINKNKKDVRKKIKNHSAVDDKFFKLEELDEYLTKEDKKENQGEKIKEAEDEDEENVDLFDVGDNEDEDDDDDEDDNESDEGKMIKYADFFDSPNSDEEVTARPKKRSKRHDSDEENAEDNEDNKKHEGPAKSEKPQEKRVKFNLTNDSDEEMDDLKIREDADNEGETKSSYESRQERLQKRIKELEKEAISEKPWQLKGEIAGPYRPQHSLLENVVDFDISSRPAPVTTGQTVLQLEDIIKQRINNKAWDDVERKFKPVVTPLEYKKKLVMDQEKSKKSLAQIYEDDYVKQKEALDPENEDREIAEPKEHVEIREMMTALFSKLDALSNFHYTPAAIQPELKIVSNMPAITMEEVAPVATTDATLLAPEEIKSKPRGELVGRAERTITDMKRERRKKKLKQRVHQKASEKKEKKLVEKLKPGSSKKYTKGEAAAVIKKLTKDRNIVKMDETSNKIGKSSTAFFNQLQDQVKSQIKAKSGNPVKKKDKTAHSAVKLKL